MRRDVSARIALDGAGSSRLAFAIAVAEGYGEVEESFTATVDGRPVEPQLLTDEHGGRVHVLDAGPGRVEVQYRATVLDTAPPPPVEPIDVWRYLRPSRYCEADALEPVARAEFGGLEGAELLAAIGSWVGTRLAYVPGSSLPTDGAVRTLLSRSGVCRDFAHLVVAFLRARDVPARVAAVYAPGLAPMDFHAVAEALIDGQWRVVDATALAPRTSLVRIATGRDAADTAFLTSTGAELTLAELEVTAVVDELPSDDADELVTLR